MKGSSKVIMGATLVMVVTLAVVLVLIFVLLAELYCSLLRRRRHLRNRNSNNTIPSATTARANASPSHTASQPQQESTPPFRSIYAQGVLQAPRNILLPAVSSKEEKAGPRKQNHYSQLDQFLQVESPSPPPSFISIAPASKPNLCHDDDKQAPCTGGEQQLVYISNPIYENESQGSGADTPPFETPDTSPSRLERSGSSEEDDEATLACVTPPLTPMKKLPAEASSVSLRDARSLATSCSDSRSNNGLSSSSASPCTSPSW
ncbi:hypothetical protein AAZX31_08G038200 [Glycine max]|uniref:Uncharacterized protein n=1 Tax=Glycine soja TaxID=3848 RepID=A0A445J9J1_GLYSO|nr:putative protein TPRXL [Glycine soja]KAG4999218.1 hypothetical protein JHK87_020290 [Glycine soja]KAG5024493.1 hypothetical protein JHK86_020407 [Glycine max]RZB95144.1 hypothetical protein D0Y65_019544 [Glycine soja]